MAPSNSPTISKRVWFRWEDQTADEPTNTIVLTSAQNRFVDIRIFKNASPGTAQFPGIQSSSQLDWAFAGTSSSETKTGADGHPHIHSTWQHFVDSRSLAPEEVTDEGDMAPADGETIERGSMTNPATGQPTAYEESWSSVAALATEKGAKIQSVVLVLHDDAHRERGMVVRVGQFCQGVVRVREAFALERWVWAAEGGWKREARMGDLFLPCGVAMDAERTEVGSEVKFQEHVWKIVEMSQF